jgi:hypothetical protein
MKTHCHNSLLSFEAAVELIRNGEFLTVAGSEDLLARLPRGNWIGGTTSYFTALEGGVKSTSELFVTCMPESGHVKIAHYDVETLPNLMGDAPANGFTFAMVPHGSRTLQRFAAESRFWPEIFVKPVVGWVAGIDPFAGGHRVPKVIDGRTGAKFEDSMVAAHVQLPADQVAFVETINIFESDPQATIRFSQAGFEAVECTINGSPCRLADFLVRSGNAAGKLPLIGDFAGASINVSVQSIEAASGRVRFYAPVFPDVEYRLAKPVDNYQARFAERLEKYRDRSVAFSCNCILNYIHGALDGKQTGSLQGPVTFGELAYLLHNQTMVILHVE